MAIRPVFVPLFDGPPFVKEVPIEFHWYPGMARSQAQRSIDSLHRSAALQGIAPVLEISSKSRLALGVGLSAFNLCFAGASGKGMSVECAYQGSKVFRYGGPYTDLYSAGSREAKKDSRLQNSGELVGFDFQGTRFPTRPETAFYDWLYLCALSQNPDLASQILRFRGFTDIAFNPRKSISCQARAAALFVSLGNRGLVERVIADTEFYFNVIGRPAGPINSQKCGTVQGQLPM